MESLHETPDEHDQLVERLAAGPGHPLRPLIDDALWLDRVEPADLDVYLAAGWRHFGEYFFRYSASATAGAIEWITPLRLRLDDFAPSRSQRRVLSRNRDLDVTVEPARIDVERLVLFDRHSRRFCDNAPESLASFMSPDPARVPCPCVEIAVRLSGRLLATSYLDVGRTSTSSVYAMFDPEFAPRSLGILTMLCEIDWSKRQGKRNYYPGYATESPSAYDYKKRFTGLDVYDWATWRSFS